MVFQADDILQGVNPPQAEAIRSIEGPLLIAAGAGTGKTRVITRRIANVIAHGVEPWRILGITFTNKAAEEMSRRVRDLTGADSVHVSTFHSFCAYVLRREADKIGVSRSFTIYDTDDSTSALARVLKDLGSQGTKSEARDVLRQISAAKNHLIGPAEFATMARTTWSQLAAEAYVEYQKTLAANNALDFDDLLLRAVEVLSTRPDVLARYQDRYRYVLVDEFQDTNACQYQLVRLLAEKHRNLCVTGDPDQAIYSWRGASPENLFTFEKDFPESRCVRLEQNYRSTATILAAASGLVRHNRLRKDVTLWTDGDRGDKVRLHIWPDDRTEANSVVRMIQERIHGGEEPTDFAIFYRVHALSRTIEESLILTGLPYTIVGATEFYGRREIKDLLAYLRLSINPTDDHTLLRILNVPRRGIGPKTAETLVRRAKEEGRPLLESLRELPKKAIGPAASRGVEELVKVLVEAGRLAGQSIAQTLAYVVDTTDYLAYLGPLTEPEAVDRRENVEELLRAVVEFEASGGDPSTAGFLERVALLNDSEIRGVPAGHAIHLMTLHAAKGLEFPVVFLVGLEEGLLPHFGRVEDISDLEEERRLLYVGMTRAEKELHLSRVEWRTLRGRGEPTLPSRFLREIPAETLETSGASGKARQRPSFAPVESSPAWRSRGDRPDPGLIPERSDEDGPAPGDRVRHPAYGEGEILDVLGWGQRTRVKVRFDREGTKDLIYEHAQLTRI